MSTERRSDMGHSRTKPRSAADEPTAAPGAERQATTDPDPTRSPAWRSMRWHRSIFGRTPELRGVPAPIIVVGAALLAAVLILYLVISRQSPLIGDDVEDPGQPVLPQIQQEAPANPQ